MDMQQMLEILLANQYKVEADRKADQARMEAKIDANRENDLEELKGMINENLKDLKEGIKSSPSRDEIHNLCIPV
jgi:hypothetical protein